MHHSALVAASDAPAWLAGSGTVAAVGVALAGLVYQNWGLRRERQHRLQVEAEGSFLRKSEQARSISSYTTGGGTEPVQLNIINASKVMVTAFEAVAIAEYPQSGSVWKGSFFVPGVTVVIPPGEGGPAYVFPPAPNLRFRHEIAFSDDNGARWHKYGVEGLREVPNDFTLLVDLQWDPSQSQTRPGTP